MTITERIKQELFNADMNYYDALDRYTAEFPHGTNFCYDNVSSKAATMYATLQRAWLWDCHIWLSRSSEARNWKLSVDG